MKKLYLLGAVCALSLCNVVPSQAAPVYADSAVTQDVIFFGSGVLTGAPDNGGAFLSNTVDPPTLLGSITAGFFGGLQNGLGDDIVIHDCCSGSLPDTNEFADVFVSNDGLAFTFLGSYGAGVNSFDLNGIYASIVHFVRIVNTSTLGSPDIDAFQGNYAAVPLPAATWLFGSGLLGLVGIARRKKA